MLKKMSLRKYITKRAGSSSDQCKLSHQQRPPGLSARCGMALIAKMKLKGRPQFRLPPLMYARRFYLQTLAGKTASPCQLWAQPA